jgi:hypothetical protein
MNREEVFRKIAKQTGKKPMQCDCEQCKHMCHTPCLGTPQDILALINAGYSDKLCYTEWIAGMIIGFTSDSIAMVQIKKEGEWCVFFHDGKCELHEKGLKPTEGRLAYHEVSEREFKPEYNLTYQVAKEWGDGNLDVVKEIVGKLSAFWNRNQ